MIRHYNLGFGKNLRLRFAAATLFIVGCSATPQDPNVNIPPGGASGVSGAPSGGSGGAGPSNFGGSTPAPASAGQPTVSGGTGGAPTPGGGGTGGKIVVPTTGGTSPGAAGAATGVAGTPSSGVAGAAPAADCDTYKGTVKADSTMFSSGFGTTTDGSWKGYSYTYKYPATGAQSPTVTPDFDANPKGCFKEKRVCIAGNVPANDGSGVGIGWNIGQASGNTSTPQAITKSVVVSLKGGQPGMRVALSGGTEATEYCHILTSGTGGTIAPGDFKTKCYGDEGEAYDGAATIKAIQVYVPGSKTEGPTPFDFCIVSIEPG